MLSLDHFVFGASELSAGIDWMGSKLGKPPVGGGKHPLMSTHNALWHVGDAYLEVIATDPNAPAPGRPRCFGLDDPTIISRLQNNPRLLTWVARAADINDAITNCAHDPGPALTMSRGDLKWKLTVPDDGHLPGSGILPHLIEWPDLRRTPSRILPDQGLRVQRFAATCKPETERLLEQMGADHLIALTDGTDGLSLTIERADGDLIRF